jgi:Fur family transcriptional regulator, ferric uptake regulator
MPLSSDSSSLSPVGNAYATSARRVHLREQMPIVLDDLKARFTEFLKEKNYRNTQERFDVLESLIAMQEHFSADDLYHKMKTDGVHVSRATVYSTLDLLTRCNILMKHRFQGDSAHFELADTLPNHDHLICVECGHIIEFQEEHLHTLSAGVAGKFGFKTLKHSLQIFAVCNDTRTCEHNKVSA